MTHLRADLSLMLPDGTTYDEAAMAEAPPGSLGDLVGFDGAVELRHDDIEYDIGDTLLYAVNILCGEVVPRLVAEGTATFRALSHEEVLTFTRKGEALEISSDYRETETLPATETLIALVEAGRRLQALLPRLWPEANADQLAAFANQVGKGAKALGI